MGRYTAYVYSLVVFGFTFVSACAQIEPRLAAATTFEEARAVYLDAPLYSDTEKEALRKTLALAFTLEETWWVYYNTPWDSDVKKEAGTKLEKRMMRYLNTVTTFEKVRWVYYNTPPNPGSEVRKAAFLRYATLLFRYGKVEE